MRNLTSLSGANGIAAKCFTMSFRLVKASCAAFILLSSFCPNSMSAQDYAPLKAQLHRVIAEYRAQVGIAIIVDGKDTLTVNNDGRYPMMSVYKFHQALAVARRLEQHAIPLDTMIYIRKEDLIPDTYSPFRDKYPEGNAWFPVKELLTYTLQWSDNNACDILFDRIVDTKQTDALLRRTGISDFNISATEQEMQSSLARCYDNWSTPLASATLLDDFVAHRVVSGHYYEFISQTMLDCTTGQFRLLAGLPEQVHVGHKTGTSRKDNNGVYAGVNDIGFVYMDGNRRYSIAVYVKDSKEDLDTNEHIIAEISRIVYSFLKGL